MDFSSHIVMYVYIIILTKKVLYLSKVTKAYLNLFYLGSH